MLKEFTEWFSTKNPVQQRAILSKLEEVFNIQNNFGYIERLQQKIRSYRDRITELTVEIESNSRYIQSQHRIKELEFYIKELENRPISIDTLYGNLPKTERDSIKSHIITGFLYKNLQRDNISLRNKLLHYINKTANLSSKRI